MMSSSCHFVSHLLHCCCCSLYMRKRKCSVGLLFLQRRVVSGVAFFCYLVEISLMKIIGWCQLALWRTSVEFEFFYIFCLRLDLCLSASFSPLSLSIDVTLFTFIALSEAELNCNENKEHQRVSKYIIKLNNEWLNALQSLLVNRGKGSEQKNIHTHSSHHFYLVSIEIEYFNFAHRIFCWRSLFCASITVAALFTLLFCFLNQL